MLPARTHVTNATEWFNTTSAAGLASMPAFMLLNYELTSFIGPDFKSLFPLLCSSTTSSQKMFVLLYVILKASQINVCSLNTNILSSVMQSCHYPLRVPLVFLSEGSGLWICVWPESGAHTFLTSLLHSFTTLPTVKWLPLNKERVSFTFLHKKKHPL